MTPASKDRRQALLGELESIRTLLGEDAHGSDDLELLVKAGKIPLLLPEENIPTLLPEDHVDQRIPVLSAVAEDTVQTSTPTVTAPPTIPADKPDPLDAIRQAAAKVAAARHREPAANVTTADNTSAPTPAINDREKLVEDIVKAALPRVELLLRELVQEALLQDKLRGGKR